jgi:hypothetical protein
LRNWRFVPGGDKRFILSAAFIVAMRPTHPPSVVVRRGFLPQDKVAEAKLTQMVMPLTCIWEVPNFNVCQDTEYPE